MSLTACPRCGQALQNGNQACTNCGLPFDQAFAPQATDQVVAPAAAEAGPWQPATAAAQPITQPQPQVWQQPVAQPLGEKKVVRLKGRHVALASGLVALFLIGSIAVGAMTAPKPKPAGELVGQLPFGPEGGRQTFDNGNGTMDVPEGALDAPKTIEVYKTVIRERITAQSPSGTALIIPPGAVIAYTFGPITITLNRPITIILPLPAGVTGLVFVTANGQIQFFPGTVRGRTIAFRLTTLDLSRPGAIVAL